MPSARFKAMDERLKELRAHLIPARFDPTGSYTPRVYSRTLAFRVLAHAEFESFIEDRAMEHVDASIKSWASGGRVNACLLALVAYRMNAGAEPSSILNPPQKKSPGLMERIEGARKEYGYYVRVKNHGIKEENILRILLPLGIVDSDIDSQWLSTTEAWATSRGETAHQTGKVQVRPDPLNELKSVREIKLGFRQVDALLRV